MNSKDEDFNLIKKDLVDRVGGVETQMALLSSSINSRKENDDKQIELMQENINKLSHIIVGNGNPGISEKIRNLEESERNRKTHVKVFYGAIVMGFGEWIWRTIGHLIK